MTVTILSLFPVIRLVDLVDIVLVSTLLYVILVALRRTRTTFLIFGFLILAAMYIVALGLGLRLATFLFNVLFAVIVVGLIVLFHDELRTSVERLFSWDLRARARPHAGDPVVSPLVQIIATVLTDLANDRTGALIAIRGKDDPTRHIHSGVALDGAVSEALLKSIFDTHSIGHDGAIVIADDRVALFGAHLPLSTDASQLRNRGTRHAAALGLSARTDSLCLVVSEERGTISVAHQGDLRVVHDAGDLTQILTDFFARMTPPRKASFGRDLLTRHFWLKLTAIAIASVLWFLVVHEGEIEYRSFTVPVEHAGVGSGLSVSSVRPGRVKVIVSGPRRSFYFVDQDRFHVYAKLFDHEIGAHEITLTATDLTLPDGITFVNVVPRNILFTIEEQSR
jgi:uncharacterized protein (TIGR00159 family)